MSNLQMILEMLEAPGRHFTEWDGAWTDEVAAALNQRVKEMLRKGTSDNDDENPQTLGDA